MDGPPAERTRRNVFVPPTLPPGSAETRATLTAISQAVTDRSAEVYAAFRETPPRAFIDAVCRSSGACWALAELAEFLDVDVPRAQDAIQAGWSPER